jgi:hypothetical protein
VQITHAAFEPAETGGGFATANIVAVHIARAVFDGPSAEGKARRRAYVRGN